MRLPTAVPGEGGGGGEKGDGAKRQDPGCTYMLSAAADAWTRSRGHVLDCLTGINKLWQPRWRPRAAEKATALSDRTPHSNMLHSRRRRYCMYLLLRGYMHQYLAHDT